MTEQEIKNFLSKRNYDIRIHRNARWFDQKCTPDVVCIVADCIINYINNASNATSFTSKDIWFSNYAIENVHAIFRKVNVDSESASNEYDKFFGQPIKLFAYAGMLRETKSGRCNRYEVANKEMLEFISIRERNALQFLVNYIIKVISDSELAPVFDEFFKTQTASAYEVLKETFYNFTVANTDIGSRGSSGKLECGRIFTKVVNILAFSLNKKGTERGRISQNVITYDMLMYNRDNFRDIYAEKPKSISRKDYMLQHRIVINEAYLRYMSYKAKRRLKAYNDRYRNGLSEMPGDSARATHIHHIFPSSEYPEISYYLENMIALTPNQHLNLAHPQGNTKLIDKTFQYDCLIVKTDIIRENIESERETLYSFEDFVHILMIGLNDETYNKIENNDYAGIKAKISLQYSIL